MIKLAKQNIKLLINRLRDKMYPAQMLEVPSDLRQVPAYFENPNIVYLAISLLGQS